MSWLTGDAGVVRFVAAKAVLMYATALIGLRLGERRTLAQWNLIDFSAAVAVGAIVGRTAVARDQSYVTGAVALVALIVAHRVFSLLRFSHVFGKLADHRIRVLVADGQVRKAELRRRGLTRDDLEAQLRLQGVLDLADVRYALHESRGGLSVVPAAPGPVSSWPNTRSVHPPASSPRTGTDSTCRLPAARQCLEHSPSRPRAAGEP